jgi:ParB/RepB/Spo0J family partition protein
MDIKSIQIDNIRQFANNPCQFINQDSLNGLIHSIDEYGLNVPIIVKPIDDEGEFFELIDGKKRLAACKELGYKNIDAVVKRVETEVEQLFLSLTTNLQRDTLTPLEVAQSIEHLLELEVGQREIGEKLGRSQSWVCLVAKILTLEPDVQKLAGPMVSEGNRLSYYICSLLVGIPKEEQVKLANTISTNRCSIDEARKLIAVTVREKDIRVDADKTNRLRLFNGTYSIKRFLIKTNAFLDNLLSVDAKKFEAMFETAPIDSLQEMKSAIDDAQDSIKSLGEYIESIRKSKLSDSVAVESFKKKESKEYGDDEKPIEVNKINPKTASITMMLRYLGLKKNDMNQPSHMYGRNGKTIQGRLRAGPNKRHRFWSRPMEHKDVLKLAKEKYMERIKAIHPDVHNGKVHEDPAVLNAVWDEVQHRFKIHGFELNK